MRRGYVIKWADAINGSEPSNFVSILYLNGEVDELAIEFALAKKKGIFPNEIKLIDIKPFKI